MPVLEKMTVLNKEGRTMNINKRDFDAKLHKLPGAKKAKPKGETPVKEGKPKK